MSAWTRSLESAISSGSVSFFAQCVSHLSGTATRLLVSRLRLTVCTSAVMNIYGGINGGVEITTLLSAQTREC